jgi:hypothetical protein
MTMNKFAIAAAFALFSRVAFVMKNGLVYRKP